MSENHHDSNNPFSSQQAKLIEDMKKFCPKRSLAFNDLVNKIVNPSTLVYTQDDTGQQIVAQQHEPIEIQKSDLLELRISCFPHANYITKLYLCGFLTEEQAVEAREIETKLVQELANNMSYGEVVDVSDKITPQIVLGQLTLPLTQDLVNDYLYRVDRISMVASLIDLNGKNLHNRYMEVEDYLPQSNIYSHAPDDIAGCCHVLEELMLIRNNLSVVSGATQTLLSRCAVSLFKYEVNEVLSTVQEHPSNPGVRERTACMGSYFQIILREPETLYDKKPFQENLLRAIKSLRGDISVNRLGYGITEEDFGKAGDNILPWNKVFVGAYEKAFHDIKRYYSRELSDYKRQQKIANQRSVGTNLPSKNRGRTD